MLDSKVQYLVIPTFTYQKVAAWFGKTFDCGNLVFGVQDLPITCDIRGDKFGLQGYVTAKIDHTD